jgi:hypothetical protein
VHDRVRLGLDPEPVALLDVPRDLERSRFAGIDDDAVKMRRCHGARACPQFTGEEIIP